MTDSRRGFGEARSRRTASTATSTALLFAAIRSAHTGRVIEVAGFLAEHLERD